MTVVNGAHRHRVKDEHTETISDFSKQLLFDDYLIKILNLNRSEANTVGKSIPAKFRLLKQL